MVDIEHIRYDNGISTAIYILKNVISPEEAEDIRTVIDNAATDRRPFIKNENNVSYWCMKVDEVQITSVRENIIKHLNQIADVMETNTGLPSHYNHESYVELRKIDDATKGHVDSPVNDDKIDTIHKNIRLFSTITALNSDYEGGEICFPVQGVNVKLQTGDVIIFPPYWTHPHYTNKLNGTFRYTITAWLCKI
jgi:predicted 2-oxoglutarate/Fe(II)-dependent dioxygenase YbiX|tara:strand:- start:78 stop:659 length:582 start_codon:yes stop_codon:yes gene_type:complete